MKRFIACGALFIGALVHADNTCYNVPVVAGFDPFAVATQKLCAAPAPSPAPSPVALPDVLTKEIPGVGVAVIAIVPDTAPAPKLGLQTEMIPNPQKSHVPPPIAKAPQFDFNAYYTALLQHCRQYQDPDENAACLAQGIQAVSPGPREGD